MAKARWTTYLWEIVGEDSELCGEQFCTELRSADMLEHAVCAHKAFPDETLKFLGKITQFEAETLGLDTY